jgi:DNA-binding NtrC family response regulator
MASQISEQTLVAKSTGWQGDRMNAALVMQRGDCPPPDSVLAGRNPNRGKQEHRRTVLIVDDEHLIADTLADILNDSNFMAVALYDGPSALDWVRSTSIDILITDVVMPEMNGIELAKAIKSICPKTRIVLFSGQAQTRDLMRQAQHEGYRFELWAKPMNPDDVLERLKQDPEWE